MLRIRFFRTGKKNRPFFRIVVTDRRNPPKGGRFLEVVGFFDPLTKEKGLKKERIQYWLSVGAKLSDRVHNLLVEEKVLEGEKIPLHKKKKEGEKKTLEEEPEASEKEEVRITEETEEAKETEAPGKKQTAEGTEEGKEEKGEPEKAKTEEGKEAEETEITEEERKEG